MLGCQYGVTPVDWVRTEAAARTAVERQGHTGRKSVDIYMIYDIAVIGYRFKVGPQADFVSRRAGRRRAFRVGPYVVVDVGEVGPRRMTSAS